MGAATGARLMPDALATRDPLRLLPDASRVITQLFVPGHALAGQREGRASGVVEHVLALDDAQVAAALEVVAARFEGRHADLAGTFRKHADRIVDRLVVGPEPSGDRRLLLGATFTHEYSVEAAALCNPSIVPAPDQSGTADGELRFVMSVRQIGEGHRSSIGFRGGVVDRHGRVTVDPPGPFATTGAVTPGTLDAESFRSIPRHSDGDAVEWVLDGLRPTFTVDELAGRLAQLEAQSDVRRDVAETAASLREVAARTYDVRFDPSTTLGERVLFPVTGAESNGMEDARFLPFVDGDGTTTYVATYTAFDGRAITQQLLVTPDFASFAVSPLGGTAAANKGLALFPRLIGGRYYALSRHDGATNAVASSDDIRRWSTVTPLDVPTEAWESLQVGNCGPPIETVDGWLVLTHGVGAMRTYSIGALLLDLDDPTIVLGHTAQPLITPQPDEQDGYVPNVVYSCGGLRHGELLLVPFGIGDANVGFATLVISEVLAAMREPSPTTRSHHGSRAHA
ncbi:MAG: glycosidase [Ilumatobacteraceae bacterium]